MPNARAHPKRPADFRVLYLAIVVASALRLFRLGAQSVWGDETLTLFYYTAGDGLADILQNTWKNAGHPPLYFLIVHYCYRLGHSEFMLRFPSAVFGIAAVPVAYAVANRLFGRGASGLAALVVALSPIHIWYSQEARMYSLQILLVLASTLFFARAWQEHRARDLALYALFTVMGLFTHLTTAFVVVAQALFVVGGSLRNRRTLALWVAVHAMIALAFAPWLVNFVNSHNLGRETLKIGYERPPTLCDVAYGYYTFSVGYSLGPSVAELHHSPTLRAVAAHWPLVIAPALVFGALTVLGLAHARRASRWAFLLLVTHMAVPTALAVGTSLLPGVPLNPRYMLPAIVPYWILLALGVGAHKQLRTLYVAPAAAVLLTGLSLYNHYFQPAYAKQDMRSAVELINERGEHGDVIIVSSIELGGPLTYYFKRQDVPYFGYPPGPGLVAPDELGPDIERILRGKKRAWLVLGRTWSSDPQGLIPAYLGHRWTIVEQHWYSGVTVLCYDLGRRLETYTTVRTPG